jgi:hypothetical protein
VDETYIRVKGKRVYLYRAVDSCGATIDFLLSAKRDAAAAKRFPRESPGRKLRQAAIDARNEPEITARHILSAVNAVYHFRFKLPPLEKTGDRGCEDHIRPSLSKHSCKVATLPFTEPSAHGFFVS